jgi:5-carboxymethyl-2-hydroxymuconic-semialdehyde dehydrogenase
MNKPVAKDAFLANVTAASRHLERFRAANVPHLIAGVPDLGTGATFDDLSPADNSVLAKVASGGRAEIDRAAKAAMAAFPPRTSGSSPIGRPRRGTGCRCRRRPI